MEDYKAKEHMSFASADILARETLYFIPHQPVLVLSGQTISLQNSE